MFEIWSKYANYCTWGSLCPDIFSKKVGQGWKKTQKQTELSHLKAAWRSLRSFFAQTVFGFQSLFESGMMGHDKTLFRRSRRSALIK